MKRLLLLMLIVSSQHSFYATTISDQFVEAAKMRTIEQLETLYAQDKNVINAIKSEINVLGIDPNTGYATELAYKGLNALMIAAYYNNTEILQWLLDHTANPNIQAQAPGEDYDGFTPLMFAIQNLAFESANILIHVMNKEGLELENKAGKSVMDLAQKVLVEFREKIQPLKKKQRKIPREPFTQEEQQEFEREKKDIKEMNTLLGNILDKIEEVIMPEAFPEEPSIENLQKQLSTLIDQLQNLNGMLQG